MSDPLHTYCYNHRCSEYNENNILTYFQQHSWDVNVTCRTFMRVYTARSLDEFLRQALNTSDCWIVQEAPENLQTVPCAEEWFT